MNKRPIAITSEEEYREAYPGQDRAVLAVVVNPATGEVARRYYEGNEDRIYIGNDVTHFVYINQWTVTFHEVSVA